jgi:menaquinone-dependent protoporphyrinogen IX oxidase
MNIGIVFYSFSGHTLSVSKRLQGKLKERGYEAGLEQLEPAGSFKFTEEIVAVKDIPSLSAYDLLVFAAPVHGGRIAGPMAGFLKKSPSLSNKPAICVVTHFLPYSLGAKQMLQLFKPACATLGAQVIGTVNVPRLSFRQNKYINKVVDLIESQSRTNGN